MCPLQDRGNNIFPKTKFGDFKCRDFALIPGFKGHFLETFLE